MDFQAFPSVTTFAAPLFLLAIAWEWWAVKSGRANGQYETRDAMASMAMGAGNVVVNTVSGTVFVWLLLVFWPYRVATIALTPLSFAICFVIYDLVYYWKHRLAHRVRWWWMEHVTHHSSTHYNLTTALRQPWLGPFTGLVLIGAPMVLAGFHPHVIALAAGINLIYQFWIHTETIGRMPAWFEFVFNTPSHHRVHHATNPRYLDANYAGVLIIWDRLFGSFVPELDRDKPVYGIVKPIATHNPVVIAFHEVLSLARDCKADGFRPWRWLLRAVNAPGWSAEGKHGRSIELKKAFVAAHPEEAGNPGLPARHVAAAV
jgi:sterol desaturase/sphingolipid hydroxylase (fatty acid hydroxylase superfamily)